jgi:hypothetical protein
MTYNLQTASLATGIHKSTILRSIRGGRISATRNPDGWSIEVAELHRVFPALPQPASADATAAQPPILHEATSDALVKVLREQVDDMRQERDRWHAAYEASEARLQRLLPPPATADASPGNLIVRAWRRCYGRA